MCDTNQQLRDMWDRISRLERRIQCLEGGRPLAAVPSPAPPDAIAVEDTDVPVGRAFWCLYTDGGARPTNPGPAGAGIVLVSPLGAVAWTASVSLGRRTNNYAEYAAVAYGVRHIANSFDDRVDTVLVVRSDSKLVLNCLSGRWKCRSPALKEIYKEAMEALESLKYGWKGEWVKGHGGDTHNEEADRLATAGAIASAVKGPEYMDKTLR